MVNDMFGKQLSTRAKSRKRIMFIKESFNGGGAARVICRLMNRLCREHQVYFVFFGVNAAPYYIDPAVCVIHVKSRNYEKAEKNSALKKDVFWRLKNFIELFRIRKLVKRLKKQYQIDTTVSFLTLGNLVNIFAGSKDRKIVSERMDPRKLPLLYFICSRLSCCFADSIVFQSKYVQAMYNDKIKEKSCIIPNPTEVSCKALPVSGRKIVAVGRLAKQKNHKLLIKAFSIFHNTHQDYHLHIYGEGSLLDELIQTAYNNRIQDFVHFEGFKKDVHAAISDAEQFVLSSDHEGLSNALMEAMMMGHACISTACAGSEEIIENEKNGLLVPVGDAEALSEAMCRLSDDPGLRERLGRAAALSAEEWKTECVVRLWESIL